jgi:putative transposase
MMDVSTLREMLGKNVWSIPLLLSPSRRRACIDHVRTRLMVSERRACQVLGQHRSTQRHHPTGRADEELLVADMIELARQYGRYGYRRIAALLRDAGWRVSDGRIERLWRREGLKVPSKQPKKGRLWLNDGSCVRLRPEYRNHVWSITTSCIAAPMTARCSGR